jgi:hypothetical protein
MPLVHHGLDQRRVDIGEVFLQLVPIALDVIVERKESPLATHCCVPSVAT